MSSLTASVECVWPAQAFLGEGPIYDPRSARILWVDIKGHLVHQFDPESGARQSWKTPSQIGCLVLDPAGTGYLAALRDGFVRMQLPPGGSAAHVEPLCDPEREKPGNRFNDGTLAPDGSFWAGTMDDAEQDDSGTWWRFVDGEPARVIDTGYRVTNGPAFHPDGSWGCLTDSARQLVCRVELANRGSGIESKQTFLQFGEGDGYPDGMTFDEAGQLWIAFWDGGCIRRFNPQGEETARINLPVRRPTSVCIGRSADELFVTSAALGAPESEVDGGLFRIRIAG